MKPKTFLHWLVLGALLLGIFFRFYNLDHKVFWHDETLTPMRAAGYMGSDVWEVLSSGQRFSVPELQQFQRLKPDQGWGATLASLKTHPEHPPLYYLGARLAMSWVDNPVLATRGLAAVISLLAFPSLYWLMRELFAEPEIAQVALALFALSPFQVLYAQEARQYSLLTVATLASSAALLWAVRRQTKISWLPYAATVAVGLNTSVFFSFAVVAHGLYMAIFERLRRASRQFLLALALGGATFLPWATVMASNWHLVQSKTAWVQSDRPWTTRFLAWGLHVSRSFLDLDIPLQNPVTWIAPLFFLALGAWALWSLFRRGQGRAAVFIMLLVGVNFVALALPDALWGGLRSILSRYMSQLCAGFVLLLAILVGNLLVSAIGRDRVLGKGLLSILLACGLASCLASAPANSWWSKTVGRDNPVIAEAINSQEAPLVLFGYGSTILGTSLSMSHLIRPDGEITYMPAEAVPANYPDCDFFIFRPRRELIERWQQSPEIEIQPLGLSQENQAKIHGYRTPLARISRTGSSCKPPRQQN